MTETRIKAKRLTEIIKFSKDSLPEVLIEFVEMKYGHQIGDLRIRENIYSKLKNFVNSLAGIYYQGRARSISKEDIKKVLESTDLRSSVEFYNHPEYVDWDGIAQNLANALKNPKKSFLIETIITSNGDNPPDVEIRKFGSRFINWNFYYDYRTGESFAEGHGPKISRCLYLSDNLKKAKKMYIRNLAHEINKRK